MKNYIISYQIHSNMREEGKISWNAALSFIINGNTDEHLEMIEGGVVKRLLEDKWNTYAQVIELRLNYISSKIKLIFRDVFSNAWRLQLYI